MSSSNVSSITAVEREQMSVDIAGVGFGPAMGGFLTTLSRRLLNEDGTPRFESKAAPGMPLQVICYERAEGLGFGVSGAVTRARRIRESFAGIDLSQIPMAVPVKQEKLIYLLDPIGASHRSLAFRLTDRMLHVLGRLVGLQDHAFELPFTPKFMRKDEGMIFSLGQFNQWVSEQVTSSGVVQLWPGTPVSEPLIANNAVCGVRLIDQGVNPDGSPTERFMPGIDVRAALTVVADGPIGAIGRKIDAHFGVPQGHEQRDWALGMKMVFELREDSGLESGTVLHTIGFPEPEIFGFLYVHPERLASLGIFIPSWLRSPVRTAYRYLQHFMLHPYLWRYLQGGILKSWGAKSIQESGRRGEPFLVGNGYARIGEGSGSTNVLANSGVDEAWCTGVQLAEAVAELLENNKPFTRENLEKTYVRRRRESWVDREARAAADARNGFQNGVIPGLIGTLLAGFTGGAVSFGPRSKRSTQSLQSFFASRIPASELRTLQEECAKQGSALHDCLMDRCGWPQIPFDGKLLVSHQDALLVGGSVQSSSGYAKHVMFIRPELCRECESRVCIEMCSGQAITRGENAVPVFDREKCVYCGACLWNCEHENVDLRAGAGGLHSTVN